MARGWFQELLVGDIAKKLDTGGLFSVEDALVETKRLAAGEITHTGPIYGYRTRLAGGKPGQLEDWIFTSSGLGEKELKRAGLKGSRRPARLLAPEISVEEHALGLKLSFALPKGSYATTLLREFMKKEPALPEE
jgi:tRNA pseudouridine13 synthase